MENNKWKKIAIIETIVVAVIAIFIVGYLAGRGKKPTVNTNVSVDNTTTAQPENVTTETTSTEAASASQTDNATEKTTENEVKTTTFDVKEEPGLKVNFKQSAKWGDEKKYYFQYDLTVENTTESTIEDWGIKIPVADDLKVENFWNAKCEVVDGILYVSPIEYNNKIEAKTKKTDIGIQMSSKEEPKFEGVVAGTMDNIQTSSNNNSTETKETVDAKADANVKVDFQGKLEVKGTKLVNQKGEQVQLHGVSTHGIAWFPDYVNKESFQSLQSMGANVVRLAMYTGEGEGYCTGGDQAKIKQLVKDGVEYATQLDLYAIIDWHILSDNNPNTYKTQAIAFFDEMSKLYADNDHVIYEICNEPNSGTSWEEVKKYANEVIPVIRKNDADAVILVGTPSWCQDVDQVISNPVADAKNVMYVVHFYAATHKESIRDKMVKALDAGVPVFVSEFSICDASGNGALDYDSANKWLETLNKYGVSYVGWNLSNKNESSSILKPDCTKTSGYGREDLSDSGKWLIDSFSK